MSTNIVARYAEKKKENHIHARMVGGASDIDKRNRIKLATWNCESKGVSFLSSQKSFLSVKYRVLTIMENLKRKLEDYGQEHLLQYWDQLSQEERDVLEKEILELDLIELTSYYDRATSSLSTVKNKLDDKIQPIPENNIVSGEACTKEELKMYNSLGLQEVANGRVAVLLLAGGQGTRLGVTYPKGMYEVGLPSHKSLFQLQAERIRRLETLAEKYWGKKGEIIWYIMTSEATHDSTIIFLRENDYFGLKEKNVMAFKQGMLPCFTLNGKIILDEKHKISRAPDGNGGLYKALKVQGVLDDMVQRGIRSIHVHSVDNILVKVADPIFLGYCLSVSTDCGVKVIEKSSPSEPVGVVCKVDDHYQVVEYSEISKETAELRQDDGRLVFNAANICNHYFTVDFLLALGNKYEASMELHAAKKKIPYIDDNGKKCTPTNPNGIKIEKFVFDVFKFAKNFAAWQGIREEEFSPLKNSDSAKQDCPSTARRDLLWLHKKWLLNAGAQKINGDVEVSPLRSYAGENLTNIAQDQSFEGPSVIE
ncbi:UDP-N-acetylhexosamine pyrophosphorylase isoform X1 [Vespula pensylvanica]|uniref:UDP-N-acetylhexosamine pyrophosphorylase isoform X1 n=1 Tax=Vespula pensylvanica TaxID=30213 RepID=UPI001CBA4B81|nr:UDP-N-acetylhexosamine pyrophosphorylase isoform X1 [Vespula pensylvanica]XP_043682229.1 UDP-N-acetylhexosamine pyrophosphorylase isoform X1 [Vespula pensylvanica]XP_043682230.1 UDP-N-acetylhexosamine pyrophosphorylase isoform X1 [Vespula pensylvanica]XP_043682231.1 UDP-N-acetylhexosamine pyrophosphorylase isoform X1 [Vespula pensylvanica]XP_043682232.1 UDP-N-acetylhexosamine pyrophosphorylase isoform X1 [Vespula pensylvanica]